jgi:hypothetical protein
MYSGGKMEILNKKQFYDLYLSDQLGNHLRNWPTYEEFASSGYKNRISIRSFNDQNKFCFYYIKKKDIIKTIKENKLKMEECVFNESAPDEKLILQGELTRDINGLFFAYSEEKKPMREVIPIFKIIRGLSCKLLLESILLPNSYSDLMLILDKYPDHVIELGVYDVCLGIFKNQNIIFWEVRKY